MLFKNLLLLLSLIATMSCKKDIEQPKYFQSYKQVENFLDQSSFRIDEVAETDASDWITGAHYQSKDGVKGFLTLEMRGKPYHFQNVPLSVWKEFKATESKGAYYHSHLKGRYNINLNTSSTLSEQCRGITKKGSRCKRSANASGYCFQHA